MKITLDTQALQALANDLGLMPAAIDRALANVLNELAPQVMQRAQRKIVSRVKLSPAYIEDRMSWSKATVTRPVAIIKSRERATRLATFMAQQRIIGATSKAGAKGDPLRGIPPKFKQAGVYTGIKPGSNMLLKHAFLMPLRAGSVAGGNGMGIFVHTGPGKKDIRQLYGPSVNQLFRGVSEEMQEPVLQEMEDALRASIIAEMNRIAS